MAHIIGSFEKVKFPKLGIKAVTAKIDTGAYSGAIHATHIKEHVAEDGQKELAFNPLGKRHLKTSVKKYRQGPFTSSNGQEEMRYVIRTLINIRGTDYPITISLSDRGNMRKRVLIGRRFLRSHGFLVDVNKTTKYRTPKKGKVS